MENKKKEYKPADVYLLPFEELDVICSSRAFDEDGAPDNDVKGDIFEQ